MIDLDDFVCFGMFASAFAIICGILYFLFIRG